MKVGTFVIGFLTVSSILCGSSRVAHADAPTELTAAETAAFEAMTLAQLQAGMREIERTLGNPTTRLSLSRSGHLARYIADRDRFQAALDRRAFPDGGLPPQAREATLAQLREMLGSGYDLSRGFERDLGNGFTLHFAGARIGEPAFLRLSQSNNTREGRIGTPRAILIQVSAQPSVVRLDWTPNEHVEGGVDLLGARGTLDISTGGIRAEAVAYLAAADLRAGPVTVRGYAGGIGLKLELKDGKIGATVIGGLGVGVTIDLLAFFPAGGQTYEEGPYGARWYTIPHGGGRGYFYIPGSGVTIPGATRSQAENTLRLYMQRRMRFSALPSNPGPHAPQYASNTPSVPWVATSAGATGVIDGAGPGMGDASGRYADTSMTAGPAGEARVANGAGIERL